MVVRFLLSIFMFSLAAEVAQAKILATNFSGESLTLSFHGPGCQQFANRDDRYPACTELEINANETAWFSEIIENQAALTKRDKLVWPEIKFRTFGLRYKCRFVEVAFAKVCFPLNYWLAPLHVEPMSHPERGTGDDEKIQISVDQSYVLEILPGWTPIPRPKMDCRLTHLIEDPDHCKPHSGVR